MEGRDGEEEEVSWAGMVNETPPGRICAVGGEEEEEISGCIFERISVCRIGSRPGRQDANRRCFFVVSLLFSVCGECDFGIVVVVVLAVLVDAKKLRCCCGRMMVI